MRSLMVFVLFIVIRLASVFIVQTYFVPDEYWQSLEVAHKITFGYGYLTWEWIKGIRSYVYPAIIAGIYKILSLLNLDTPYLLVIVPRIFQAILSAISDYRFYVWNGRKKWAIFLISISYFWFYTSSRTLANTLETGLTTIALSYYPWESESSSYIWFATLCCFVRPTAFAVWMPLFLLHLMKTKLSLWELVVTKFIFIGGIVCAACVAIDTYFYGRLIFTPFEFLKYNFVHGIGEFYGTHPWHWYFTVGLPTILGINFLPFLVAVVQTVRSTDIYPTNKCLLAVIAFTLIVFSNLKHKEFRFILCLLPMCSYLCCVTLSRWSLKASKLLIWIVAIALFVGNALPMWYLSTVHQKGPIDTINTLGKIAQEYKDENNQRANILFLMPCHSTPFYSHIHQNITMKFLTCEPNLNERTNYIDEAEQFYKNPSQWLRSHLPVYPKSALPSHVVLFEPLSKDISDFLTEYDILHKIPYAEYVTERTGKNILIYEKHKSVETSNQHTGRESPIHEDHLEKEL